MTHVVADFVRETVSNTGTSLTLQLSGAADDCRAFSAVMNDGDSCDLYVEEKGRGRAAGTAIYDSGLNQLALTVRSSTFAGGGVDLNGNAKVGIDLPGDADRARRAFEVPAKNKIINGNFDFWQRGTSVNTTSLGAQYLAADRWPINSAGSAIDITQSQQSFTLGQTDVPGEPEFFCRNTLNSSTSLTALQLEQRIESVRTLAGKKVTVSFYAKADAAQDITPKIRQHFGSGGSPSSAVTVTGTTVSLTTSWQRIEQTFDIGSLSGKTLGSNDDDYLGLLIGLPTSGTWSIDIARAQVEKGSVATEFESRPLEDELAACQRYYEKSYDKSVYPGSSAVSGLEVGAANANATSSDRYRHSMRYKITKRATPSITVYSSSDGEAGNVRDVTSGANRAATIDLIGINGSRVYSVMSSEGNYAFSWQADAEL